MTKTIYEVELSEIKKNGDNGDGEGKAFTSFINAKTYYNMLFLNNSNSVERLLLELREYKLDVEISEDTDEDVLYALMTDCIGFNVLLQERFNLPSAEITDIIYSVALYNKLTNIALTYMVSTEYFKAEQFFNNFYKQKSKNNPNFINKYNLELREYMLDEYISKDVDRITLRNYIVDNYDYDVIMMM